MVLLARAIRNEDAWATFDQTTSVSNFPVDVITDLAGKDANEVSFWQVGSKEGADVQRLAAALSITRQSKQLQNLTLRFVTIEAVKSLGIQFRRSNGDTFDEVFAKTRHFDLRLPTCAEVVTLAKVLVESDAISFGTKRIENFIRSSFWSGYLSMKNIPNDIIRDLHKREQLSIRS